MTSILLPRVTARLALGIAAVAPDTRVCAFWTPATIYHVTPDGAAGRLAAGFARRTVGGATPC